MNILDEIVARKRAEIWEKKSKVTPDELKDRAAARPKAPDFAGALRAAPMGLIAEVKHRSPSAGIIRDPFEPEEIAREYAQAGAQAISVLMDQEYFGGGESDFKVVRAAVSLPMLYKEFVVDAWQVWHAASLGASAVLLIAAVLPNDELADLAGMCLGVGMTPLVEVHTEVEMERARTIGAPCIGINNRDLATFTVSLDTTFRLRDSAPEDGLLVSESGIRFPEDVARLREAGIEGILVGEHLLRQFDIRTGIAVLMEQVWGSS
jgi:indole-3-glycerol phosphate synthase